jgi:hypothetical protein
MAIVIARADVVMTGYCYYYLDETCLASLHMLPVVEGF